MTYLEMQDAVMDRLALSSTEARTRIKINLNLRYRDVQSSVNTAKTRRSTFAVATTSGSATTTVSGVAEILTLFDPTTRKDVIREMSLDEMRQLDPNHDTVGCPERWAEQSRNADRITLRWYPKPDATYTFSSDALVAGTDMSANGDVPTIPMDYHDTLVLGALADEYDRMEKHQAAATRFEKRFESRKSELRLFLAKSSYLKTQQTDSGARPRGWRYEGSL